MLQWHFIYQYWQHEPSSRTLLSWPVLSLWVGSKLSQVYSNIFFPLSWNLSMMKFAHILREPEPISCLLHHLICGKPPQFIKTIVLFCVVLFCFVAIIHWPIQADRQMQKNQRRYVNLTGFVRESYNLTCHLEIYFRRWYLKGLQHDTIKLPKKKRRKCRTA